MIQWPSNESKIYTKRFVAVASTEPTITLSIPSLDYSVSGDTTTGIVLLPLPENTELSDTTALISDGTDSITCYITTQNPDFDAYELKVLYPKYIPQGSVATLSFYIVQSTNVTNLFARIRRYSARGGILSLISEVTLTNLEQYASHSVPIRLEDIVQEVKIDSTTGDLLTLTSQIIKKATLYTIELPHTEDTDYISIELGFKKQTATGEIYSFFTRTSPSLIEVPTIMDLPDVSLPSRDEIREQLIEVLKETFPESDLRPTSATVNLLLEPLTSSTYTLHAKQLLAAKGQDPNFLLALLNNPALQRQLYEAGIEDVEAEIEKHAEEIGLRLGIPRGKGRAATGVVRLFFSDNSPRQITQDITFTGSNNLEYKPIRNYFIDEYSFDESRKLYFYDITVECTQPGEEGNLEAGQLIQITDPTGSIQEFSSFTISGGSDAEPLDLYLRRLVKASQAPFFSKASLTAHISKHPAILSCEVLQPDEKHNHISYNEILLQRVGGNVEIIAQTTSEELVIAPLYETAFAKKGGGKLAALAGIEATALETGTKTLLIVPKELRNLLPHLSIIDVYYSFNPPSFPLDTTSLQKLDNWEIISGSTSGYETVFKQTYHGCLLTTDVIPSPTVYLTFILDESICLQALEQVKEIIHFPEEIIRNRPSAFNTNIGGYVLVEESGEDQTVSSAIYITVNERIPLSQFIVDVPEITSIDGNGLTGYDIRFEVRDNTVYLIADRTDASYPLYFPAKVTYTVRKLPYRGTIERRGMTLPADSVVYVRDAAASKLSRETGYWEPLGAKFVFRSLPFIPITVDITLEIKENATYTAETADRIANAIKQVFTLTDPTTADVIAAIVNTAREVAVPKEVRFRIVTDEKTPLLLYFSIAELPMEEHNGTLYWKIKLPDAIEPEALSRDGRDEKIEKGVMPDGSQKNFYKDSFLYVLYTSASSILVLATLLPDNEIITDELLSTVYSHYKVRQINVKITT